MKRFIGNILLFTAILIGLNLIPYIFRDPYWGNKIYSYKFNFFLNNKNKFNAVFLGSSRMNFHINPMIFDDLLPEYNMSSFNLGAAVTFNPEIYYLCERLMDNNIPNLKYIFIEFTPLADIADKNMNTGKNYYWHNLPYLLFSISYIHNSDYKIHEKIDMANKYIKSYVLNFIHNFLSFSHYNDLFKRSVEPVEENIIGKNKDGFYPLDERMKNIEARGRDARSLRKRSMDFINNPAGLNRRISMSKKDFAKRDAFLNRAHSQKVLYLIKKAEKKNIHLIFIISPRLPERCGELLAIKRQLPPKNIIELADVIKYPELYEAEYCFDIGHTNKKGAEIFTKYLVNEFKKILKREKQ